MSASLLEKETAKQRPLHILGPQCLTSWLAAVPAQQAAFVTDAGFAGKRGQALLVPRPDAPPVALLGCGDAADAFALGDGARHLPEGDYKLAFAPAAIERTALALAWQMGAYQFDRYKKEDGRAPAQLYIHAARRDEARDEAAAVYLARDLVNTPANDLGTEALADAVKALAKDFDATYRVCVGDDLLKENYPLVHAVGRASTHAPRLAELHWGKKNAPRIAIVGKGVVFDTGGLDIKAAQYMRLMKKDMGGAANALALARLIMSAGLNVRLHVVIPIVDNAIAGNAYRPGDVLPSRKGLSVEIDNTDAEGRLVLADALCRASEDKPELLVDFATLTGAARVALGPELAPFYTDDDVLAADLQGAAAQVGDPVWRMPLWSGYDKLLDSPIADICHTASSPMAGSVTAALFLRRFVSAQSWLHFDIFAWVASPRPGHPKGGDAQGPRAVFAMLKARYG